MRHAAIAVCVAAIVLPSLAQAHECTTTRPLINQQNGSLTLFQTITEDWDELRDAIMASNAITLLEGMSADTDAVYSEAASLTRSAQVEQTITDNSKQEWRVFWRLADHHGDCTEVQVEIQWPEGGWSPDPEGDWWAPVQEALLESMG